MENGEDSACLHDGAGQSSDTPSYTTLNLKDIQMCQNML